MIVNTNEVIYDDGRESSIIHFSNNHIHAPICIGSQLIIFSWCSSKKKDVIKWKKFARCQFLVRLIILELRRKLRREKKKERFSRKTSHFFEERARASEYTYTQK